jgi:hypothetical protein
MSNNPETTPGQTTSPGLLPITYPDLHKSGEVEWAVQQEFEPDPNNPHQRIATYLGSLVGRHGLMGGSEERRQAQVSHHVMNPEDIPESYFDRQREIARQQGHGDIQINDEMRRQHTEALIADQTASLNAWAEYLSDPAADYPAWFRYYTMRNVLKLADYDKEKERFRKRSQTTTAPYPELNREALAYVYERLNRRLEGQQQNDEQLQQLADQANFNKLYSHALAECVPSDPEQLQSTAGEWTKYKQLGSQEGSHRAHQLAQSLQGYGTGWCTAGESSAKGHLRGGDFHVYYSYDEEEQPTVPRVAVRMEDGEVAEVRGIDTGQNLEPAITDIAMERVQDLPGGEEYLQAAEDMKRVTDIEARARQGQELTARDVYFLWECGGDIQSFGYGRDPRIGQLLFGRDPEADMDMMLEEFGHAQMARGLMDNGRKGMAILTANLDKFPPEAFDQTELVRDMVHNGWEELLAQNLDKFLQSEAVDQAQLARDMMHNDKEGLLVGNLDKFQDGAVDHVKLAQDLMDSGWEFLLAENLEKFPVGTVNYTQLAREMMRSGWEKLLAQNLDKFPDDAVDHAQLARRLLESDPIGRNTLAQNLDKFPPEAVDHAELAHNLLESGPIDQNILVQNLDKFLQSEAIDQTELARRMMDNGLNAALVANLDKFPVGTVDRAQLARNMIEKGVLDR